MSGGKGYSVSLLQPWPASEAQLGAGKWDLEVKMKVKLSGKWQEMGQLGNITVKNPGRQSTLGTRLGHPFVWMYFPP